MDRWLQEGSTLQPALFVKPDDGLLSTSKQCSCKLVGEELIISDDDDDENEQNGSEAILVAQPKMVNDPEVQ